MGRIFGLLLVVIGIWAATEVYLNGTAGAFGGIAVAHIKYDSLHGKIALFLNSQVDAGNLSV